MSQCVPECEEQSAEKVSKAAMLVLFCHCCVLIENESRIPVRAKFLKGLLDQDVAVGIETCHFTHPVREALDCLEDGVEVV